jgi:hypothetical protein
MPSDPKLPFDKGWTEPESEANIDETQPEYPYNHVIATDSGHSFEMDDTPGRERIRLQHRSGTFNETHSDGTEVHKIIGDGYEIVAKDKYVLIKGICNITINGDAVVNIKGNKFERIEGNYQQEILGDYTQLVRKKTRMISDGDMTIGANPSLLGTIRMVTGGNVYLDTDLRVDGSISSKSVTAEGRVDAGTGVSAGPLGFVSVFGGLSIGVPVAAPGNILCAGNISALPIPNSTGTGSINGAFLNGIICNFGISNSIWAFDQVNTFIYNTHVHPKEGGAPPILQQVGFTI